MLQADLWTCLGRVDLRGAGPGAWGLVDAKGWGPQVLGVQLYGP